MRPPARHRVTAALVLAAALAVPGTSAGAQPTPPGAAAARDAAQRASAEVERLVTDLQAHLTAQEAAQAAVAGTVTASITADGAAQDAAQVAYGARARHSRTVRALYTSGGALSLYTSVLEAGSLADLSDATRIAGRVLHDVARDAEAADEAHAVALRSRLAGSQAADAQVVAAAEVVRTTETVESTLAQARRVLADLTVQAEAAEAAEAVEEARRRVAKAERLVTLSRGGGASHAGPVGAGGIPEAYRALYQHAAQRCPGMRWTQLAAVGHVETRHGRNVGPSSAGAQGPMQFMPGTWAGYGVDGDGDGTADPWNPVDAIPAAADYLCRNGAGGGTPEAERRALLRYNNAQWYVDLVQGVERDLLAAGV